MARTKAPPANGNVSFDVPDDVFSDDGEDAPERDPDAAPLKAKDDDESAPKKPAPPKDKPPQKEASAPAADDDDDEEQPEEPPLTEPSDPAYLLAQERAARADMEARWARELEEKTKPKPEDREAAEEQQLQERKRQLRQKAMQAVREGDEAARMEAMWELGDIERDEHRRDTARQLREMRAGREQPQQQGGRITQQQADAIEAQTFRAAYGVTDAEAMQMDRAWRAWVDKYPAWSSARTWSKYEKALKLVRPSARRAITPGDGAAIVAGGQHSAPSKSGKASAKYPRESREWAARALGVSLEDYDRTVNSRGR